MPRYMEALTDYLRRDGRPRILLSFTEIERIIGRPLPASATTYQAFWANSERNPYAQAWMDASYHSTTRGLERGQIAFEKVKPSVRTAERAVDPEVTSQPDSDHLNGSEKADVILVGCVSTKQLTPQRAADLYTSELFAGRRAYAEQSGKPWFVLSALYGVVNPDTVIEPYDVSLNSAPPPSVGAGASWCLSN